MAVACGALAAAWCRRAMAVGAAAAAGAGAGAPGTVEAAAGIGWMALQGGWPRVLQILQLLREHGLILAALLSLSAFFSMAETSITTLWPWKVRATSLRRSIFFLVVDIVIAMQMRMNHASSFATTLVH